MGTHKGQFCFCCLLEAMYINTAISFRTNIRIRSTKFEWMWLERFNENDIEKLHVIGTLLIKSSVCSMLFDVRI